MAKNNIVDWLENHVEKVALGLSVLLVALAVFRWGVSSPRDVGGTPPDRIDRAQRDAARRLKKMHLGAKPLQWEEPNAVPQLYSRQREPFLDYKPMISLALGDSLPSGIIDPRVGPGRPDLFMGRLTKHLAAPDRPVVWAGAELPEPQAAGEELADRFSAHVTAVIDHAKILKGWRKELSKSLVPPRVIYYRLEAQVQEQRPDGAWSDPRAVNSPAVLDRRTGNPYRVPALPAVAEDNADQRRDVIDALAGAAWQTFILERPYPRIYAPPAEWVTWRVHLPETSVTRDARDRARAPRPPANTSNGEKPKTLAPPPLGMTPPPVTLDAGAAARPADTPRAAAKKKAKGKKTDEPQPPAKKKGKGKKTDKRAAETEVHTPMVPSMGDQLAQGKVQVWFHHQSLQGGRAYRYRVRVIVLNPLYGYRQEVKEGAEKDAEIPTIEAPWSPWSEPTRVVNPTEFYVSGASGSQKTVKVDVFALSLGQRVRQRFTVQEGGRIGGSGRVRVLDPVTGKEVQRQVAFDTGSLAVRFEFNRIIYKGQGLRPTETVAIVYLDGQGDLLARTYAEDQHSDHYKALQEEADHTAKRAQGGK